MTRNLIEQLRDLQEAVNTHPSIMSAVGGMILRCEKDGILKEFTDHLSEFCVKQIERFEEEKNDNVDTTAKH